MKTLYNNTLQIASQHQIKFYIVAYGIILLMTAAAAGFQQKEIILPELAALSIGCFLYKKKTWTNKPMHLFLLPSSTAFIGFFINQLELNAAAKIVLVLMVMFTMLQLIKSTLAPAIATGLLPIVTNCDSYVFLISILLLMGLLSLLAAVFFKPESSEVLQEEPKSVMPILIFLFILIVWVILCSAAGVMQMAAVPPIIVLGYECVNKKMYSFNMMYKQVTALVLAAFIGAQTIYYLDNFLLAAVINFISVTVILHFLKMKMPPVYGMVMLPMILPGYSHVYFALDVAVSSLMVLGTVYFLINKKELLRIK